MNIIELCQAVGVDNISIQPLHRCVTKVNAISKKRGGGTEISFATEKLSVGEVGFPETAKHRGMIVWFPVDKLPEEMR